jgi:hypothetical protein
MHVVLPVSIDELNAVVRSDDPNDQAFVACLLASIGAWRTASAPQLLRDLRGVTNGETVLRSRLEPLWN